MCPPYPTLPLPPAPPPRLWRDGLQGRLLTLFTCSLSNVIVLIAYRRGDFLASILRVKGSIVCVLYWQIQTYKTDAFIHKKEGNNARTATEPVIFMLFQGKCSKIKKKSRELVLDYL